MGAMWRIASLEVRTSSRLGQLVEVRAAVSVEADELALVDGIVRANAVGNFSAR
jgi:hypothetical protein